MGRFRFVLFDWGGTLMSEEGPLDIPMALWPEVRAIEGARETLAALVPGHRLGIATNATASNRAMIERALARVSLREYITDIFCYTEIGARKDSAAFWAHVLDSLGARPDEVAMVGDTLEQDVFGPRRQGVFTVWFNEGGKSDADARGLPTVTRLVDVLPILGAGAIASPARKAN